MIRSLALTFCLSAATAFASPNSHGSPAPSPSPAPITGTVADPTGAIVPNAEIDLVDPSGTITISSHSGADGVFLMTPPRAGSYTLVVSEPGFQTTSTPVVVAVPAAVAAAATAPVHLSAIPLHIVLPIAALSTNVHVSADANEDLTDSATNHDTSVMTSSDLKALPIFDSDYATAMSAFMDDGSTATGGSGLLVDGVESGRATVSASAVQEVRINQEPYSAQYYWPGRGQMEIITKSAADHYHGQFNAFLRDSDMNAQNALAPSKPFEQRRYYEGHVTGPIFFARNSSFLTSFSHSMEKTNAVIDASVVPTPDNPDGIYQANVPTPWHDTSFSARAAHKFGDKTSAYMQYSYYNGAWDNQGVGGQTLANAAYNTRYHEDDFILHADSTLTPTLLNQLSIVGEHDQSSSADIAEAPHVSVNGYFTGGSGQNDYFGSTFNLRIFDMASLTRGRHFIKAGINIPNLARRAYDDNTNQLGSYSFAPTLAADGVTVLATALQNYQSNNPSGYSLNYGDTHFIYHQQEMGAFIQDQYKISDTFSITPGVRYDWQNFQATERFLFSPRVSFAWVLSPESKTVVRGGGGIYYDRVGSGPLLDLVRYSGLQPRRRSVSLSLNPATQPVEGCVPVSNCINVASLPVNRVETSPDIRVPYQIQYGLSIERQFGEKSTATISGYTIRGISAYRSVDVNAPTPESGYTLRPDPDYLRIRQMQSEGFFTGTGLDISYQGRLNKWFTGFGRYTLSHWESDTGGLGWFPQNQYAPNDEWADANWDRRNRLGFYGIFNSKSVFNLSGGVFANSGTPWTILTGTDPYGDDLFNARPDGVSPNTENLAPYVDVDLRWGHDWAITGNKDDEAPHLGFSASAFNLLNHPNVSGVDTTQSSPDFGDTTSVSAPRRLQLAMRFEF